MNCCASCFQDVEIRGLVFALSTQREICDFCLIKGSRIEAQIIDTKELKEMFDELIGVYKPTRTGGASIYNLLQDEWNIFNLEIPKIKILIEDIYSEDQDFILRLAKKFSPVKKNRDSLGLVKKWNEFKVEIVKENRFFLESILEFDVFEDVIKDLVKTYIVGSKFYRGRISGQRPLGVNSLGKPSNGKATPGRANPSGIPYLYVAKEIETVFHEVRALKYDQITIGQFDVIDELNIITFKSINQFSPFVSDDLKHRLKVEKFLKVIENELAKPLRRFDSDLDYIPTQYICEFIKSLGFDGVEYGSSMYNGGSNLVIFNDNKLSCKKKSVIEMVDVEMKSNVIIDFI